MKGHTQQTQQRGLLFTIHHEFQGKTKFSHNFRHQMHMPGGTNHPWATFLLGKGPLGQLSPWAKGPPGNFLPGQMATRAKGPWANWRGGIFPRAWVGASLLATPDNVIQHQPSLLCLLQDICSSCYQTSTTARDNLLMHNYTMIEFWEKSKKGGRGRSVTKPKKSIYKNEDLFRRGAESGFSGSS